MIRRLIFLSNLCLFLSSCVFQAQHDADYDPENPNKVYMAGKVKNAVDIPVSNVIIRLNNDSLTVTNDQGLFSIDSIDPGIYTFEAKALNPLYDILKIADACSLWAGRVIEDTSFYFKRAVWDMEMEKTDMPAVWRPLMGAWRIIPDPERPLNKILGVIGQHSFGYYGQAICEREFSNFIYEINVQPLMNNGPAWKAGVLFCWQDTANYYLFIISETEIALHRHTNRGRDTTLFSAPQGVVRGIYYKIKIERFNPVITIFLKDEKICELHDGFFASGKVGLWLIAEVADQFAFHFDNIWVEPK